MVMSQRVLAPNPTQLQGQRLIGKPSMARSGSNSMSSTVGYQQVGFHFQFCFLLKKKLQYLFVKLEKKIFCFSKKCWRWFQCESCRTLNATACNAFYCPYARPAASRLQPLIDRAPRPCIWTWLRCRPPLRPPPGPAAWQGAWEEAELPSAPHPCQVQQEVPLILSPTRQAARRRPSSLSGSNWKRRCWRSRHQNPPRHCSTSCRRRLTASSSTWWAWRRWCRVLSTVRVSRVSNSNQTLGIQRKSSWGPIHYDVTQYDILTFRRVICLKVIHRITISLLAVCHRLLTAYYCASSRVDRLRPDLGLQRAHHLIINSLFFTNPTMQKTATVLRTCIDGYDIHLVTLTSFDLGNK